jgi:membrane-bound lytic murein transglycosylase B
VSRSFELFQVASVRTSQQHFRTPFSIRPAMRFLSKKQIWEDSYNRSDDVSSRPNDLLHKASRAYKVQLSGCHSSWSGCSSFIYGNCVHQFNRSDARATPSERGSIQERISCEFGKPVAQLSVRTPYVYCLDGT